MYQMIKNKLKWIKMRREWFRRNAHNHCSIIEPTDIDRIKIGKESYGMIHAHFYNNEEEYLQIGNYCSIGEETHFVFGEHDYKRLSTFPFDEYVLGSREQNPTKGMIKVEDDVWIGMHCIILSGVTIHQGAVIGAGSIVRRDIPPYAVYAGGEIKRYRFERNIIERLLTVDFGKLTREMVEQYRKQLYSPLDDSFFEGDLYTQIKRI